MEKHLDLQELSRRLTDARLNARPISQLSKDLQFSRADAYEIQEQGIQFRLNQGEKRVGLKMGLTSEAKRKQMNLNSPLYGELTAQMQVSHQGKLNISNLIHPKIEPEVAFLITQSLKGNVSREQVLQACGGIAAALEILDSRYEQFKYFSMEDVIADNSSSSHFVVGPWQKNFSSLDVRELGMKMSVNGQMMQQGFSKEISGDPVVSVIQLCQLLAERNRSLEAGSIVLAGAATAAVELKDQMHVQLKVDQLPEVEIFIQGNPHL